MNELNVEWPAEWLADDPIKGVRPLAFLVDDETGEPIVALSALLESGVTLWAIVWPAGQRLLRIIDSTAGGAAREPEVIVLGELPETEAAEGITQMWDRLIEAALMSDTEMSEWWRQNRPRPEGQAPV